MSGQPINDRHLPPGSRGGSHGSPTNDRSSILSLSAPCLLTFTAQAAEPTNGPSKSPQTIGIRPVSSSRLPRQKSGLSGSLSPGRRQLGHLSRADSISCRFMLLRDLAYTLATHHVQDPQILEQTEKGRTLFCRVKGYLPTDESARVIRTQLSGGPVPAEGLDQNRVLRLLSVKEESPGTLAVQYQALKRLDWLGTHYQGGFRESADHYGGLLRRQRDLDSQRTLSSPPHGYRRRCDESRRSRHAPNPQTGRR